MVQATIDQLWIACIYLVSLLFETTPTLSSTTSSSVVNCLHLSCIFALWNNLRTRHSHQVSSCELLAFILYLCSLKQPDNPEMRFATLLWIACIYLVSLLFETTIVFHDAQLGVLWIACIYLVSLLFETTRQASLQAHDAVVNCLHLSCIFALWNNHTLIDRYLVVSCELLAFILYLCSLKQPVFATHWHVCGCEFLAFILYLCSLKQPPNQRH